MPTTSVAITITTPASVTIAELVANLSAYWGYRAKLPNGTPNPQTQAEFVKAHVALYVRESYIAARAAAAVEPAVSAARAEAQKVTTE